MTARELSSRELLAELLDRVERYNPVLNAVVTLDVERAMAAAARADAAIADGHVLGPLHGLPMTVKDTFATAAMRTTAGATELAEHVPDRDAMAVARLRQAGAVVFGKTNSPAFAGDWQTVNDVFGPTNNPWDLGRTPGGSSGGSAAALSAGLTPLEIGSDIGGSIRNPAHFCGIVGHKPTRGVIPYRGHVPSPLGQPDLAVAGPMARRVTDVRLALSVLVGPDDENAVAWKLKLPKPRTDDVGSLRLAALVDEPSTPVDESVRASLRGALDALEAAGAAVDRQPPLPLDLFEVNLLYQRMVGPEVVADHQLTHTEWLAASERRQQLRAEIAHFFTRYDALLLPAFSVPAFPHDHRPMDDRRLVVDGREEPYSQTAMFWAGLATLLWLPATVVPVGLAAGGSAGLPVGVQIVGPYLGDRTTLGLAAVVERLMGSVGVPPLLRPDPEQVDP